MIKERIFTVRLDDAFYGELKRYQQKSRISQDAAAIRSLLKMGLQTHKLITENDVHVPIALWTQIDDLSTQQTEELLDLLIKKLGIREINRVRELAQ